MASSSDDDDDFDEKSNTSTYGSEDDEDEFAPPQSKKMKIFDEWGNDNENNEKPRSQIKGYNINFKSATTNNYHQENTRNELIARQDDYDDYDSDNKRCSFENSGETSNGNRRNSSRISNEQYDDMELNNRKNDDDDEVDDNNDTKYNYVGVGLRLIERMGYKKGRGLGKNEAGITEPVAASTQEGRRGFGLKLDGLESAATKWSEIKTEELKMPEDMYWLKNNTNDLDQLSLEDLAQLIVLGKKKQTIDDETKFCDPEILANVLSSKTVFDQLQSNEMRNARTRSNPFETIKGNIFLNRAAVKMANMDALCDFMFTKPVDHAGNSLVKNDDLLYFADICAGPGGFSEYVFYRRGWEAKGFGFTLRGDNDFKLDDFCAGSPETFDPYYGVKNDGNVYDPENQQSFKNYVMKQTDDCGVHFVMADGGFSVEGKENIQEILSKQLYLCQCLVALSILRTNGHFVVKLFDLFTPFSVGLIYLMYKCFEEISICKPNTSRPANSERYLICKWRKPHADIIERHLFCINKEMWENSESITDVHELVCYKELIKNKEFIEYIIESNNRIGRNQIIGLIKIAAFYKDKELKEARQVECKKRCLELWQLPDQIRKKPEPLPTETMLAELLKDWMADKNFLLKQPTELKSSKDLHKSIKSIYDWYFVPIGREETEKNIRTLFLSQGRKSIQRYTTNGNWQHIHQDLNIELSPYTLLYGEIITELIGEGRSQNKINALHIIDAIVLGGKDIRRLSLNERSKMCEKFAKAHNKPYKVNIEVNNEIQQPCAPIRCKKLFTLTEFQLFFDGMRMYKLKDGHNRLGYRIRSDDNNRPERFFVPGGLMFFNKTNFNFLCQISKKTGHFYYFNTINKESHYINNYPNPGMFYGSFRNCYFHRLIWKWVNVLQVDNDIDENRRDLNLLYKADISRFIHEFLTR